MRWSHVAGKFLRTDVWYLGGVAGTAGLFSLSFLVLLHGPGLGFSAAGSPRDVDFPSGKSFLQASPRVQCSRG